MSLFSSAATWARSNWFVLAFAIVIAGSYAFSRSRVFLAEGGEVAILADLCITVPLLYCWCYWRQQPRRVLFIRAAGLASLGVWIAGRLIPAADQLILPHLSWARTIGIVVLVLIELRILLAIVRLTFSGTATAQDVATHSGAPMWIARLLLIEARFWRWVWTLIRRR